MSEAEDVLSIVQLRPGVQGDASFIFSSWLKSYRDSKFAKEHSNEVYFAGHRTVIERLLGRAKVLVAVNREDPTHIYGWMCAEWGEKPILHYVYVKQHYRNFGLGKLMLSQLQPGPMLYSHQAGSLRLPEGSTYDPYQAFGGKA